MRVLLIQPGVKGDFGYPFRANTYLEPIALECIAACLDGHEVRILDMRLDDDVEKIVTRFAPDACGVRCHFTIDVNRALQTCRRVKTARPRAFVFVGGSHATLASKDLHRPEIDAIVLYEAELPTRDLIAALEAGRSPGDVPGLCLNRAEGQVRTERRQPPANLDELPLPARHLVFDHLPRSVERLFERNWAGASLWASRGCPHRCKFCAVWPFYPGPVRFKSPARVIEEVSGLPATSVYFMDDNFFIDPAWSRQVVEGLHRLGVHEELFFQVRPDDVVRYPDLVERWLEIGKLNAFIGIDAVDDAGMAAIGRQAKAEDNRAAMSFLLERGVNVIPSTIINPLFTREDFRRMRDFFRPFAITSPQFWILTPYPGSQLWKEASRQVVFPDYDLFDGLHAVTPSTLPLEEFYREAAALYRSFVPRSTSRFLLRRLAGRALRQVGLRPREHWWALTRPRRFLRAHRRSRPDAVHGYQREPLSSR